MHTYVYVCVLYSAVANLNLMQFSAVPSLSHHQVAYKSSSICILKYIENIETYLQL